MTNEAQLEQAILKWCRASATDGVRGMRNGRDGLCRVVNLERSLPNPENIGRRKPIVYAEGATWEEVAKQLGVKL